jgi:hypothetical protein
MASLLPLRVLIYPPRLSADEAEIVVMLNCQNTSGSASATPEHGPSRIQLTLDLNRDDLIGAGQNLNQVQTPVGGCSWPGKSCSRQNAAK